MDYETKLQKLRCYWQFANVCQYFLIFFEAYGYEYFDTDVFERALMTQDKEYLTKMLFKLCQKLRGGLIINFETWERIFKKELEEPEIELPIRFDIETPFFELTLFQQVVCIQYLTQLQFRDNAEKIRNAITENEDVKEWRVESIGEDIKGQEYFLLDDNRMYIKKLAAHPPKSNNVRAIKKLQQIKETALKEGESWDETWEPVCITLEQWEEISTKFAKSRYEVEKELHKTLQDVVEQIAQDLKAKQKRQAKQAQLALLVPKRSSRLQEKELQRLEQERLAKLARASASDTDSNLGQSSKDFDRRSRRLNLRNRRKEVAVSSTNSNAETPQPTNWYFKCKCGVKGDNFDDGTAHIACESCQVWQHISCQNFLGPTGRPLRNFDSVKFVCELCLDHSTSDSTPNQNENRQSDSQSPVRIRIDLRKLKNLSLDDDSESVQVDSPKVISKDYIPDQAAKSTQVKSPANETEGYEPGSRSNKSKPVLNSNGVVSTQAIQTKREREEDCNENIKIQKIETNGTHHQSHVPNGTLLNGEHSNESIQIQIGQGLKSVENDLKISDV